MSTATPMIPIQHRLRVRSAFLFQALHQFECDLRVSIPAIVVANQDGNAFDPDSMTVPVQPAVKEVLRVNAVPTITTIPILDDVPIVIPTAGGWSMTLPIAIGDECDLVFADMAMDHWWENGGIQKQPDGKLYRHDIGDAKAHFGLRSQPRVIPNYSTTSMQLRNDEETVVVDLASAGITVTAPFLKVGATPIPLLSQNFLNWFNSEIAPFLGGLGYSGPPAPTDSTTTVLEAT
jgi:Phage protein Gp138 N-terminal domain